MKKYIVTRKREIKGSEVTQYFTFTICLADNFPAVSTTTDKALAKLFKTKKEANEVLSLMGEGAKIEPLNA